jgi:predicted nicotinamide N-methyase
MGDDFGGRDRVHSRPDPAEFIKANMRLAGIASSPQIKLYTAHPGSGLRRLLAIEEEGAPDAPEAQPPYWAYVWAGGAALARYMEDHPHTVAGLRVLDFGAGSGLVSIAAAKAGARQVTAAEIDLNGVAAIGLNAAANGVEVSVLAEDVTPGPAPAVDLVLAGDVFYGQEVANRVMPFFDRCLEAGIDVLVGDPGRAYLPRSRLRLLAEYSVPDFGEARDAAPRPSGVFRLEG